MENKKKLINQILYRSTHRGTKEMDILLGNFVKKYIYSLNDEELNGLKKILDCDDLILYNWYFNNINHKLIQVNKITKLFKNFKL